MALSKRNQQAKYALHTVTRIGPNSTLSGTLRFSTSVTIEGTLKGTVISSGELYISAGATVEATIHAGTVIVDGLVRGTIQATKRIEMREHARVYGNIAAPGLRVVDGVIFEGRCTMLGDDVQEVDIFSASSQELRESLQHEK